MLRKALEQNGILTGQLPTTTRLSKYQLVELSIKVAIFVLLLGGIYYQLLGNQDLAAITGFIASQLHVSAITGVLLVVVLMGANWGVETLKWQALLKRVDRLTFLQAVKGVLFGVTVSLFTPNRIGEYGGRMWVVQPGKRTKSVIATLVGSLAQWIVNVGIGGLTALGLFLNFWNLFAHFTWWWLLMTVPFFLFLLLIYMNIHWFYQAVLRIPVMKKFSKSFQFLKYFSKAELLLILGLSALRLALYCSQLLILLYVFGIEINILISIAIVSALFFLQTVIPSIAVLELGIRGNLALFLFGFFTDQTMPVLTSTFMLWGINLLLPALAGYGLMVQTRYAK